MLNEILNYPQEPTKIYQGEEALKKLHSIGGLSYDLICQIFINAYKIKNNKSRYAMPLDINLSMLCNSVTELREHLCKIGWNICDKGNLNKTISPNKQVCITISSGDEAVGRAKNVSTKNRKGLLTKDIIIANQVVQLSFLGNSKIISESFISPRPHWFILFHNDGSKVRVEVSCPRSICTTNNKITDWYERILLPDIDVNYLNTENNVLPNPTPLCDNNNLDIEVSRK